VDDHAPSRAAVAEAVGARGGTVVGNGSRVEDAVRLVDKHRPDVVLLAVGLPDGDGVEAARRVMTALPCPIVLLTSHTDADITAGAVEAGVVTHLWKVAGQRVVLAVIDLPSAEDLDRALASLPISPAGDEE